jgi:hypothetical protein
LVKATCRAARRRGRHREIALTAALLERLTREPPTRLRYFCSPQRAGSAFHPIIGQMERAAGLAYDDKPQAKLDKLDAVLAQTSTSPRDAALFAEMLSLPNDGRYLGGTRTTRRSRGELTALRLFDVVFDITPAIRVVQADLS